MGRDRTSRRGAAQERAEEAVRPTLVHRPPRPRRLTRAAAEGTGPQDSGGDEEAGDAGRGARVADLEATLGARIDDLGQAVADTRYLLAERLPERLAEIDDRLDRLERLEPVLQASLGHLVEETGTAVDALGESRAGLQAAADRVCEADRALEHHHAELAGLLAADRRVLIAGVLDRVLERLVSGLPRRARRRLVTEVEDLRTSARPPLAVGAGGARPTIPTRQEAPTVLQDPLQRDAPPPDAPLPDAPPPADDVAAARASLHADVLEVPSIGPARAARIVEAFGDRDELAAASPEQVATLADVPASLAQAVVERAGG